MPHATNRSVWNTLIPSILLAIRPFSSFTFAQDAPRHIVLPSTKLIACQSPDCSQVLPDQPADSAAIYPWQVMVDFNQGKVIGLTAYYDQPVTFADVCAAIDERYAKWTADFSNDRHRVWRVEPERLVISLFVNASGMVTVIYLMFDAKHPTSQQAEEYLWCSVEQAAKHCKPVRQNAASSN